MGMRLSMRKLPIRQNRRCCVFERCSSSFGGPEPGRSLGGFGITRSALGERYIDEALEPSTGLQIAVKVLEKVLRDCCAID
jgi:hypothetical protein